MSPKRLKANVHRFRVRPNSPTSASARRRSASPGEDITTSPLCEALALPRTALNIAAPAPRNVPSCDRCRTFKKKCSRTFPTCSLCITAGQKCSLSTRVESDAAQTHHLQARIEWLSSLVNKSLSLPVDQSVETIDTGRDLSLFLSAPSHAGALEKLPEHGGLEEVEVGHRSEEWFAKNNDRFSSATEQTKLQHTLSEASAKNRQSLAVTLDSSSPSSGTTSYPSLASTGVGDTNNIAGPLSGTFGHAPDVFARQCVDAYFQHVNRAYPFIDMTKVYLDVQGVDSWESLRVPKDPGLRILQLVIAIGCTTLQRAGKLPKESSGLFTIPYSDIVQECTCGGDKESLQKLVLVALYSLFDPQGMCAWTLAGIASRRAILQGLSRKSTERDTVPASELENRHRLFWSIWVLDRMTAFSLGLSVALIDESSDVPLPGLKIEEFASTERQYYAAMLQVNRHIIQLRQLEDRILRQVLLRKASDVAAMSHTDCCSLIQEIEADIETWYSNGCLLSSIDADSVPLHSSISWLSSRYYHLLLFLHYPCPLNSKGFGINPRELLPLLQKCLQLTSVLLQQKQLPLNRVTLYRIFPVGLLLMHCISHVDMLQTTFSARDGMNIMANVLEAFPREWTEAQQAARIFRQSIDAMSLAGVMRDIFYPNPLPETGELCENPYSSVRTTPGETKATILRSNIASLTTLMRHVLGNASCFIFHELTVAEPMLQRGSSGYQSSMHHTFDATTRATSTMNGVISDTLPDGGTWQILDTAFF